MPGSTHLQKVQMSARQLVAQIQKKEGLPLAVAQNRAMSIINRAKAAGTQERQGEAALALEYGNADSPALTLAERARALVGPGVSLADAQNQVMREHNKELTRIAVAAAPPVAVRTLANKFQRAGLNIGLAQNLAVLLTDRKRVEELKSNRTVIFCKTHKVPPATTATLLSIVGSHWPTLGSDKTTLTTGPTNIVNGAGSSSAKIRPSMDTTTRGMGALDPVPNIPGKKIDKYANDAVGRAQQKSLDAERAVMWTGTVADFANALAAQFDIPRTICGILAYRILCTGADQSPYTRARQALAAQVLGDRLDILRFIETLVKDGVNVTGGNQ